LLPAFRSFNRPPGQDLLVAANGSLRWYTYAQISGAGDSDWRSITEFQTLEENGGTFQEGTMGDMSAASTRDVIGGATSPPDLILGGPSVVPDDAGAVDITSVTTSGDSAAPGERYKYAAAETVLLDRSVVTASTVFRTTGVPDVIFLTTRRDGNDPLLHQVREAVFTENTGAGMEGQFDGTHTQIGLSFVPNTVFVDPAPTGDGLAEIWLLDSTGRCELYQASTSGLVSRGECSALPDR
jgi:hypothetical protein